ncbi:hypothetical protein ACVIWU_007981 [Bradyrhizobium sp. USDA 4509]
MGKGIFFGQKQILVVPAKAGTHNHRVELLKRAMATAAQNQPASWLWVPAPVRNCALGTDDTELVAIA